MTRTGTDIELEEMEIGRTRSRTPWHREPRVTDHDAGNLTTSSQDTNLGLLPNYFDFGWFWVLILFIFLAPLAIIITVLASTARALEGILSAPSMLGVALGSALCYSSLFVILQRFHGSLGNWMQRYLKLSRQSQRSLLRLIAWGWLLASIGLMEYFSLFDNVSVF